MTFVPIGFAWQAGGRKDACGAFCDDDTSPTLPANQTMAVAYQCHGSNVGPMGVLRAGNGNEGGGVPFIPVAVSENQRAECRLTEYTYDLTTGGGKPGQGYPAVMPAAMAVRRLTPRECERLMGWPDDHTLWTADGKKVADSHRYRMCGNGVVAPVAEWIGRRILGCISNPPESGSRLLQYDGGEVAE